MFVVINRVTDLPTDYPEYPDYLSSLVDSSIDENDVSTECPCYKYSYEVPDNDETASWSVNPEISAEEGSCQFTMQAISNDPALFGLNNRVFNSSNEPDYYINYDEIYEFTVESDTHPIHLHVNHFQLAEDVPDSSASKGFLGEKGDWFDVFAPLSEFTFRMKAYDFEDTHIVVHCHNLLHEDEGMMTWMQVLPQGYSCNDTTGVGDTNDSGDSGDTGDTGDSDDSDDSDTNTITSTETESDSDGGVVLSIAVQLWCVFGISLLFFM